MYVYLVRHAQSENNALTAPGLHNPSRRADPGLTRKGEAQARALERRFAEFVASSSKATVDAEIWTSCMRRCLLTTEGIARGMGTRARCARRCTNTEGVSRAREAREESKGDEG